MANTWNQAGTTWGTDRWGTTDSITAGWSAKSWNDGAWGNLQDETISLTGFSLSSDIGTVTAFPQQGWGGRTWNAGEWGEVTDNSVELTGLSLSTNVGTLEAYNEVGWGRESWGEEAWGQANDAVAELTGIEITSSVGSISPADVMGVTGQEATTTLGDPTVIGNVSFSLTGQSATASQGSLSPADVMGLTGQSATASQGSLSPADVIGITGLSATISQGDLSITTNPIVDLTGQSATASQGALSPADVFGINGQETTSGNVWSANDGAALSTAQKQFGTASLLLSDDSTRDYVQTVGNIDLSGSQNFTAECWLRPNSQSGTQRIFRTGLDAGSDNEQLYLLGNTFYATVGPSTIIFTHTHTLATDAFTAIAYTRNGNTRRLFINGVAVASGSNGNKPASGPFGIGYSTVDNQAFDGYIDEFRLSDTDRYGASNYTPVTSAFTVDANTLSLLHFDGANGSTTITDSVPPVFAFQASTGQGSLTLISDVDVIPNGQLATASVAAFGTASGFGIQAFSDVDTGSNSSYTDVATGSNTSYSDVA